MRIAMLQQNFWVGDFQGNANKILEGYTKASQMGADLVVSSELAVFGYPPQDMLESYDYLLEESKNIDKIRKSIGDVGLVIGTVMENSYVGKPLFNCAVLIKNEQFIEIREKALLPTYDVFDESRYFEPGDKIAHCFNYCGKKVSLLLCEDIWNGTEDFRDRELLLEYERGRLYDRNPVEELLAGGSPDILIVLNGSPYYWGKGLVRYELVSEIARKLKCFVVYVNQVGGGELLFDGRSFVCDPLGRCIAAAKTFEEDIVIVNTENYNEVPYFFDKTFTQKEKYEDLYKALVLGTRDYVRKTRFDGVVVALSGGIDSALVACIAVDAIGAENVFAVGMPSKYSSGWSVTDARELANNLAIKFETIPILDIYDAFGNTLKPFIGWFEAGKKEWDVTEENMQARIRGAIVMAITNRVGRKKLLVLSTGNKSEIAMGYCTLYGDTTGGFAPIADVLKTDVKGLASYICRTRKNKDLIPQSIRARAPSADLRPNQKDQDSLPPYEILDPILKLYLEEGKSIEEILQQGFNRGLIYEIIGKINRNEFKRRQMPPGLKVTTKAFGTGRRWPIAAKFIS